jgi:hypothetical protein
LAHHVRSGNSEHNQLVKCKTKCACQLNHGNGACLRLNNNLWLTVAECRLLP